MKVLSSFLNEHTQPLFLYAEQQHTLKVDRQADDDEIV